MQAYAIKTSFFLAFAAEIGYFELFFTFYIPIFAAPKRPDFLFINFDFSINYIFLTYLNKLIKIFRDNVITLFIN